MTADEGSWLIQVAVLGLLVTSYPASWMTDQYLFFNIFHLYYLIQLSFFRCGRKVTLLVGIAPLVAGWLMIAYANSVTMLFVARTLFGFSYGFVYTVLPIYLGEIASDRIRGFLTTMQPVMSKCGVLYVFAIAPYVSLATMAWIALIPPVLFVVTFMWSPESPYYCLGKNKSVDAFNHLCKLRGHKAVGPELSRMDAAVRLSETNQGTFKELMALANRRSLIIIFGMAAIAPLSGSSAITDYSQTIFSKIDSSLSPSSASVLLAVVQLVSAVLGNVFIDVVGRKPLLLMSTFGTAACTTVVGMYFYMERQGTDVSGMGWLPTTVLMLFQVAFNIGLATVTYTLLGEIFPKHLKSIVSATFLVFHSLIDVLVSKSFQTVSDNIGNDVSFWAFSLFSYMFILFVIFVIPETKGKTLDVILVDMSSCRL